jgi:hypothetical protein
MHSERSKQAQRTYLDEAKATPHLQRDDKHAITTVNQLTTGDLIAAKQRQYKY